MKLLKEKAAKAMKALKAMKLGTVLMLYIFFAIAFFVLCLFGALIHSLAVVVIALLLLVADIIFFVVFYRCPHCGKSLIRSGGNYCTHCGKWVSK